MRMKIRILQSLIIVFLGVGITLGSANSLSNPDAVQAVESEKTSQMTSESEKPSGTESGAGITQPGDSETESAEQGDTQPGETETGEPEIMLPFFIRSIISGSSIERDLTIYLMDANRKRISDTDFTIRLLSTGEAAKLKEPLAAIAAIDKQLEPYGKEFEGMMVPESQITDAQKLLFTKQELVANYKQALQGLRGTEYKDSDHNGVISIDNINAGTYVICFVPTDSMDPANYTVTVKVKDKIEYKPVEDIEQKTEEVTPADDKQQVHEDTPVENVMKDTVEYIESKTEVSDPVYAEGTAVLPAAAKSVELTEKIAINKTASLYSLTGAQELLLNFVAADGVKDLTATSSNPALAAEFTEGGLRIYLPEPCAEDFICAVTVSGTIPGAAGTGTGAGTGIGAGAGTGTEAGTGADTGTGTDAGTGAEAGAAAGTGAEAGAAGSAQTISASCTITVKGGNTPLFDANGNALYVDQEGNPATYANYQPEQKLYYVAESSHNTYYGWQNIDDKRYYFDKTGTPVTGDQIINQTEYHFGTDGVLLTSGSGIDVSKWQGTINWKEASSAISFAIIRCGLRGSNGALSIDDYFERNIKNAKANGVNVGVYVYSRAKNEVQAVEEASLAISLVKDYGLTLPIYIDMEDSSQQKLTNAQRNAIITAFCKTVQNSGYTPGLYANTYWLTHYIDADKLDKNISIWVAQYNNKCTYKGRYDIWQYSCKGSVPGISGPVDMDISYFSKKK